MKKIPPMKVVFSVSDRRQILRRIDRCLEDGMVAQGHNVEQLEARWAGILGVRHTVAVSSGSSAIEVSMRVLGVCGKDVIVPVNTFAATAESVILAGGTPRFADIDAGTFSLSLESLKQRVTPKTAGVIVVHIGGIITPRIAAIKSWCAARKLWLFEDCCHAHGSMMNGRHAGSFGIAGAYSFFSTKVVTAGEGGLVATGDAEFARKVRLLRNHGKPNPWVSYHTELGSNWRMSEICAAVALVHSRNLERFIRQREKIAGTYTAMLKDSAVTPVLPVSKSSWYKYIVLLPEGVDRDGLKASLKTRGVNLPGEVYALPLHRQPVFKDYPGEFPAADDVCSRHLCLPIFPGMTEKDAATVARALIRETEKRRD